MFAADTQSVEWRFEDNGKAEADEPPVIESYPFPTQVPTLTHEFKHGGELTEDPLERVTWNEQDDYAKKKPKEEEAKRNRRKAT